MSAKVNSTETRRTVGAALFSAAGSIPLHIAPLLIATLLATRSISNAEAGSVVSCIMAGQIVAAFLAARIRYETLARPALTFVFCVYAAALFLSLWVSAPLMFALCWFAIGLACGFLMQFGIMTAAQSNMKLQAFAWRLSFALFVSGLIALCFPLFETDQTYRLLITLFGLGLIAVFLSGLVLWRKVPTHSANNAPPAKGHLSGLDGFGLALLFLFFCGQIGFLSNTAHFTASNDLSLDNTSLAIGFSKTTIALVILWVAMRGTRHGSWFQILFSAALASSGILIATQQSFIFIVFSFVAFELFLNLLSASFMAALSEKFSSKAKALLLIATLSGTLIGPPLFGHLIDINQGTLPMLLAALAAFLPLLWLAYLRGFDRTLQRGTPKLD